MSSSTDIGTRGIGSPLAVVLLIAITVVLVGVVAASLSWWSLASPAPNAAFELAVDGETGEITLEHVAGESIDVDGLSITIDVDGESLEHQPTVPFVGATGYHETPSGPFNARADQEWTTGERASFRVADTNDPPIEPGREVTVTLAVDGRTIAKLEATAT